MAWNLFPSQNNVGTISGVATRVAGYEPTFLAWQKALARSTIDSFVISSMELTSPANNQVRIAAGFAIINGCYVNNDANVDITGLSNSTTYTIYATLNLDGNGLVSSVTPNQTTGSVPANSVIIGRAVVNGSGVVTATSSGKAKAVYTGTYSGDGTSSRKIFLGWQPKMVVIASGDINIGGDVRKVYSASHLIPGSTIGLHVAGTVVSVPSGDTTFIPQMDVDGFTVSHSASTYSLNTSSISYGYVAFS